MSVVRNSEAVHFMEVLNNNGKFNQCFDGCGGRPFLGGSVRSICNYIYI